MTAPTTPGGSPPSIESGATGGSDGRFPRSEGARPAKRAAYRALWVTLSVILGVALIGGIGALVLLQQENQDSQFTRAAVVASHTITQFCSAEEKQDYGAAYSLLSPQRKSQISESKFTQTSQHADALNGPITACGFTQSPLNAVNPDNLTVTYAVTVTRHATYTGVVTCVKEGSRWPIDTADASLTLF